MKFNKTPSFYNTEEAFQEYLAKTSYYICLQNAVSKIVTFCKPKSILELGSGTGETAVRLAKENNKSSITAVDMRKEMIDIGNRISTKEHVDNIDFIQSDMIQYVKEIGELPQMIVMLYSFHHIPDPSENKIDFLKTCLFKLPPKGRLCIAETFLPECNRTSLLNTEISNLWSKRVIEGYSSTFWSYLNNLNYDSIKKAKDIATFCMKNEQKAGEMVSIRDNEYLVSMEWVINISKSLGYHVELAEPCNGFSDSVVLLSIE
jgi:ubiquinone/menaquinone biosynthesis C-methylase UbiE